MRIAIALVGLIPAPAVLAQATWSQPPVTGPSARWAAHAVYDSQRQVVVLFSGVSPQNQRLHDLWEWDGSAWTQRMSNIGFETYEGTVAYDSNRGRIVFLDTAGWTWEYDGVAWQQQANRGPGFPRSAMTFDASRSRTVVFTTRSETWEWDGTSWQQRSSGGPLPRFWSAMTYDPLRQQCLLFGGRDTSTAFNDLWAWNGSYWRNITPMGQLPPQRSIHGMVYDSNRDRVVIYGGNREPFAVDSHDTWEWDGTVWTQIATGATPPVTRFFTMTYDGARDSTMLFGGSDRNRQNISSATMLYVPPATGLATFQPFGVGCAGPAGVPTLQSVNGSRPILGSSLQLELVNLPPSVFAAPFGITGSSNTSWNGVGLPLALDSIGMTGCQAWIAPQATQALVNQGGVANWSIPIPGLPSLTGLRFHVQGAVLAPGANSAGILVSNAATGEVGAL